MNFEPRSCDVSLLIKELKSTNEKLTSAVRYESSTKRLTLAAADFKPGELEHLVKILERSDDRHSKWVKGRIERYLEFQDEVSSGKDVRAKKMIHVVEVLKKTIEVNCPHRWLFHPGEDGELLPWFVTNIIYYPRKRERGGFINPEHVTIELNSYKRGSVQTERINWYDGPGSGKQMLQDKELFLENKTVCETYFQSLTTYASLQTTVGQQWYATGKAFAVSSGWYRHGGVTEMVREGQPSKVVVDATTEEIESSKKTSESNVIPCSFWDVIPDANTTHAVTPTVSEDDEDGDEESTDELQVALPVHPYVSVFDLQEHSWLTINTSFLREYDWDDKLFDKLIIPSEQKSLIQILMSTTSVRVEDIVRGKMSGVIVLATGLPGTGKTLTAEAFSEHIHKPLYVVQCSQLGLGVDAIEKNLAEVLKRASRWGAVLLIDEADVYIRKRDEDITQNAIVGVFLRLLEYYRGVLFMTSNRGDVIDDAILSRATAWIRYQLPGEKLLGDIWRVLSKQYGVNFGDKVIETLGMSLKHISGRTVRNLLKLAVLLKGGDGSKVTPQDIIDVSAYQALEGKDV